jgi:hypothetical protein
VSAAGRAQSPNNQLFTMRFNASQI